MKKSIFTGSAVALVTPFTDMGVDYEKLGELVEFQISNLIDAIVVCGTTGEASTLSHEEHVSVVKFVVEKVNGRRPVIAGAGSNDTQYAVELSVDLSKVGVDGLLSVVPYYNKTSQKGLIAHFNAIAKSVTTPIILYNIPTRTNLNMNAETIFEISKNDNVVGIKECNLSQVGKIINLCGEDFSVYSGDDNIVLPVLSFGGKGVISTMANIVPLESHEMVEKFLSKDIEGAKKIQLKVLDLLDALFMDVNPIPLKAAMNLLSMNVGKCRLPLVDMDANNIKKLSETLRAYGLQK